MSEAKQATTQYSFHPATDLFPVMSGEDLDDLCTDIEKNGVLEPITLFEGQILDGRNRYVACRRTGVEPRFVHWEGLGSPLQYVLSRNLHRRHLTYDQRAGLALKIRPMLAEEAAKRRAATLKQNVGTVSPISGGRGKAAEQAAATVQVGKTVVEEMIAAEHTEPDLADKLVAGKTTVKAVRREVHKRKSAQQSATSAVPIKLEDDSSVVTDDQRVVPCHTVITDPPSGSLDQSWDPAKLQQFTRGWATRWNECEAETFFIFWSPQYLWDGRVWFHESLKNYEFQQLLIWVCRKHNKPESPMMFGRTWVPIFFYRRRGCDRPVVSSGERWGDRLTIMDSHIDVIPPNILAGAVIARQPEQKPVSVIAWLVNAVTAPGEIVCDPFCRTGSTGIAATELRRRFYGIESDPVYLKLARERIGGYARGDEPSSKQRISRS